MLINTSRGKMVDTKAAIHALKTGHQGFFTREALRNIADTTLGNVTAFASGKGEFFAVTSDKALA